jgi:hypothetical protein
MKIRLFKKNGNGIILTDMAKAVTYAKKNNIVEILITYESGSYIHGDFTDRGLVVDFLSRFLTTACSPKAQQA